MRRVIGVLGLLAAMGVVTSASAAEKTAIGRKVENLTLRDYLGTEHSLTEYADSKAIVVAFLGTECPLAKLYGSRLQELADQYAPQGVKFIGINSNRQDAISEIAHYARVHNVKFPILKDTGNAVADEFGAERTPQVFVLDKDRVIRYSGRIDDQYGLAAASSGYSQTKPRRQQLVEALDQVLAGEQVTEPATEAPGCLIGRVRSADKDSKVTYSNQIARIFQKNCLECHREGQIAPFALTDYNEVAGWAEMIKEVVSDQRMPPWHADPKHGAFSNDRSLGAEEKDLIYAWVDAGAPEGDPSDLPPPVEFPEGWQIGQPDQVFYVDEKPYDVPATGTVEYQYFLVDPKWDKEIWIGASECMFGNRSIVHHMFVFAIPPDHPAAKMKEGWLGEGQRGEGLLGDGRLKLIAGAAPGTPPFDSGGDTATRIEPGTKLLYQMHYTPNGSAQQDRSAVGFKLADPAEVKHNSTVEMVANFGFEIPPGADNHPVDAKHRFGQDTLLLSLTPHMHLRGKAFKYELRYPNGETEVILDVPKYDFNWQVTYQLAQPKFMPAGTEMYCLAHFDNSEGNLFNPNPDEPVHWGDQTWEEMMIGWWTESRDIDPSKLDPSMTRTARFMAEAQKSPPKVGAILKKTAKDLLSSDEAMEKFASRVIHELPQVDRVCVTVVDGDEVTVLRASQPDVLDYHMGRAGHTFKSSDSGLAQYASADKEVVLADLVSDAAKPDLKQMSQMVGSSVHVPIKLGDKHATINFWSKEKGAFPQPAADFLREVGKLVDEAN